MTSQAETPRFAPNAERGVIGACLLGRHWAAKARLALAPEEFYSDVNRETFRAVCALLDAGMDVDTITVAEKLRQVDKLGDVGGVQYLNECLHSVSTPENIGDYSRVVRHYALDRHIKAQITVTKEDSSPENVGKLGDLIFKQRGLSVSGFLDFRTDITEELDKYLADKDCGIDTGIASIDEKLGGIFRGDILTVGARTGAGKTALKTKFMLNMAEAGHECLYITTEMSKAEMLCRVLPIACGIPAYKFNRKVLSYDDVKRVSEVTADNLSKLPIKIWAHPSPTISDIQAAIVQAGCRVVFLDYLQRFTFPDLRRNEPRTYQIAEFMKRLKTFVGEYGCSAVLGCQLNRRRDKDGKEVQPVLADLSDSGAVENESAKVGLLWQSDKGPFVTKGDTPLEWIQAKNRKGRTGAGGYLSLRADFVDMVSRDYETPNAQSELEPVAAGEMSEPGDRSWIGDADD